MEKFVLLFKNKFTHVSLEEMPTKVQPSCQNLSAFSFLHHQIAKKNFLNALFITNLKYIFF